jgi:hypothetical protein
MNKRLLIPLLMLQFLFRPFVCVARIAEDQFLSKPSVSVAGKWQLSWQGRIGMQRGILALQQSGMKLNGTFQSALGSPAVSGTIQGQNVSFTLRFERPRAFTIVFTGRVDGPKMNGKFELDGIADGYDEHGETAQAINYSWTATSLEDQLEQKQSSAVPTP